MSDVSLATLATAAGLLIDWTDASDVARTVSDETLAAVLTGLDISCGTAAERAESLARIGEEMASDFVTADAGTAFRVDGAAGSVTLTLEGGETRYIAIENGLVPGIAEPGYHNMTCGTRSWTVAVAPASGAAVAGRPWGTAVQLYSLREEGAAFGHFGTLARFAEAAGRAGAHALAISPVHALFPADAGRFSPYGPSSRSFLNILYADPGRAEDVPDASLIDWRTAMPARLAGLRAAFAGLSGAEADAFEGYVAAADERLRQHALFDALHGHFFRASGACGWQDWPTAYHDPASPAVAAFAREQDAEVRFFLFGQWLAERGLASAQRSARDAEMSIGLISDIAVGLDAGGSHGWSRRDELMMGIGIGAPPDAFQPAGQNWGITSLSPVALKRTGFRPFIDLLRSAMRHAGGVRIDHALGLRRLWVVPHGASALEGAYLQLPEADLMRLVALESHRADAIAIGEDLGVVPEGFRDVIAEKGILGMRVLPFERDKAGAFKPANEWERRTAAMTSTHDLTPLAGWWRGRDIDWRERFGQPVEEERAQRIEERAALWEACSDAGFASGPVPAADRPGVALDAAVAFTASARSDLAIVPAEDLFALEEAPNLPGTIDEHPNWRRRLPDAADALFARPDVTARIAAIEAARQA